MCKFRYISFLLISIPAFLFISCDQSSRAQRDDLVTITDMLGRKVQVPSVVDRIVGLRAGTLRLLVYMDACEMITGVEENERRGLTAYAIAHPELSALPIIGPSMGGDVELILKSRPDVIFISYTTTGDADILQHRTGIPVIAIECPEFGTAKDTLYASLRLIGQVLHKEARADSLIAYVQQSIDELGKRSSAYQENVKPLVYIGAVPYSGNFGITSTQPMYPPFIFLNARNAAAEIDKRLISHVKGTTVDKEQLMIWNPDIIFIDVSGLNLAKMDLAKGTVLNERLKAVNNDQIYTLLPYNNYAINYELVLVNAWYAGKTLYPDRFNDVDIAAKTDEITQAFLGRGIFNELMVNSNAFRKIDKNEF